MKKIITPALFLLMSAGCLSLQSCQKNESLKDLSTTVAPGKNSSGGGGDSGSGHNGKGGGGSIAPAPPVIPGDTTSSSLPVQEIITLGKWKVIYFVQGHDDLGSDFDNYVFTFNSDGSMIADDHGNQTTGSWRYQEAVFYYGIPVYGSSPYGFTMSIGSEFPLMHLNENYFVSKKTLTTIYIDSVNPNENAHLIFSKL